MTWIEKIIMITPPMSAIRLLCLFKKLATDPAPNPRSTKIREKPNMKKSVFITTFQASLCSLIAVSSISGNLSAIKKNEKYLLQVTIKFVFDTVCIVPYYFRHDRGTQGRYSY